jgi:hypothetical protein
MMRTGTLASQAGGEPVELAAQVARRQDDGRAPADLA